MLPTPGFPNSPLNHMGSPMGGAHSSSVPAAHINNDKSEDIVPIKCFGTDYFGKWNMMGMTFDSMKIDKPDYQARCANCKLFEKCYMLNHIRLLRIKH